MEPYMLNMVINPESYYEDAMDILGKVRPGWPTKDIKSKVFTDGITNKMIGFMHENHEDDMVLIRINGNKTEIFLDREKEVGSFKTLHMAGCAPNLYCIFRNGLCYQFIQGGTVSKEQVRQSHIFNLISKAMVKIHKIPFTECDTKETVAFANISKFLHLRFSQDAPNGKSLEGYDGPTEAELRAEASMLQEHLLHLNSPIVFCHNDLLLNNVIYNDKKNVVHAIDYEYAGINFQAFDIGNHFCEFAGVDEVDYSLYPNRDLQLQWLRAYLHHWNEGSDAPVSDKEVERLYVQVNKFALAAHFMWGTWALVQAKYSTIDFDYMNYAKERLGEYFRRKNEFLALQMPNA